MKEFLFLLVGFAVLCAICYYVIIGRHKKDVDDVPATKPEEPGDKPSESSDVPTEPQIPEEPEVEPETPSEPEEPGQAETSDEESEQPDEPDIHENPEESSESDVPSIPDIPEEPENPETPTTDEPDVLIEPSEIGETLDLLLSDSFNSIVHIDETSVTYAYLHQLVREAYYQYFKSESVNELPMLCREENFPNIYDFYGDMKDEKKAFMTLCGWIVAEQLSELCPKLRTRIYTAGYTAGGYDYTTPFYGFEFRSDPNVMRLVASGVYAALRSVLKPDITTMRHELNGTVYDRTLKKILDDETRTNVKHNDFFVDLREFMATAPGPYSPAYANRSKIKPAISDEKTSNKNLVIDQKIYDYIVEHFNLNASDKSFFEQTVQAIADKDANVHHLFGTDKRNVAGKYDFNAVFGETTIGVTLNPESSLADFVYDTLRAGGSARGILQFAGNPAVGPDQYGRMRPGCSEKQEAQRKSYTDDRLNVLVDFIIEDNDGNKETWNNNGQEMYYYDENGHWTKKDVQSPEDYNNGAKDCLWASSYPSGHSSSVWSAAMTMIELFPERADRIMRTANGFAVNRTIARYHWNSDTIQGRVVGSVINPVVHAVSDFDARMAEARKCIS